jgi:hypothetical protein
MDKFQVPEERAQSGKCSLFIGASQIAVAAFAVRMTASLRVSGMASPLLNEVLLDLTAGLRRNEGRQAHARAGVLLCSAQDMMWEGHFGASLNGCH